MSAPATLDAGPAPVDPRPPFDDGGDVTVIGGGLAGCEAAIVLARAGLRVTLREMKPQRRTPAQVTDRLAELVCSNSMRSDNPENAIGLLHEELRKSGSPILAAADAARVPAGDALAVDRLQFSGLVEEQLLRHPKVRLVAGEVTELPERGLTIVATGPLTAPALAESIGKAIGGEKLYFYDAIAPIVTHESIDHTIAFAASRWGKGDGADYLNLPMNREEYVAFVEAVRAGQKVTPHAFEEAKYFEGCLPIEVMAERGLETLAFGPMKPVGLDDPRTGRWPAAVVQLRREDRAGTAWNLVGFQTRLTWPEQKRIFTNFIPGLKNAEFLRLGQVHRNTFIQSPKLVAADLSLTSRPDVWFAGQVTGVEGYVESAACGHVVARAVIARTRGRAFVPPPPGTALGALYGHVTGSAHPDDHAYQPSNITWGLFPPLPGRVKKDERKARMVARARALFGPWLADVEGTGVAASTAEAARIGAAS